MTQNPSTLYNPPSIFSKTSSTITRNWSANVEELIDSAIMHWPSRRATLPLGVEASRPNIIIVASSGKEDVIVRRESLVYS